MEQISTHTTSDCPRRHSQSQFVTVHDGLAAAGAAHFVGERFGKLVEALYSNQSQCHIDTEVTYEDGRTGRLSADVRIVDAEVYTSQAATRDAVA